MTYAHVIGGENIPIKMVWLIIAKASCCSKQRQSVVTWSHSYSTSDGSKIQMYGRAMCYVEFLHRIIHHLIDWTIPHTLR